MKLEDLKCAYSIWDKATKVCDGCGKPLCDICGYLAFYGDLCNECHEKEQENEQ